MIKIMFRAIKERWEWIQLPLFFVLLMVLGLVVNNCAPKYPYTPVSIPQESEFKDPLVIDHRQRESITILTDKFGKPELLFSYADEDFKIEILRWRKSGSHDRFAIRINDIYKFTWTQFNVEKKEVTE